MQNVEKAHDVALQEFDPTEAELRSMVEMTKDITVQEMMNNLAVSTPIFRIVRDILSREFMVKNSNGITDYEVTKRIKSTTGFNSFVESIAMLLFEEISVYEKVFGSTEKENALHLIELVKLPNKYIKYNIEEFPNTFGLYYEDRDGTQFPIEEENFLINIYGYDIDNPLGKGMFRYGLEQAFEDLVRVEGQMRAIRLKYGGIVPVFAYNEADAEDEEGREAIRRKIESIKQMQTDLSTGDGAVIGVPINANTKGLKEGFDFINFSDLSSAMHEQAVKRFEDKIETFLMGANFSEDDRVGSYASDSIQSTQKDKMMFQIARIIETATDKLLDIDAEMFNYDRADLHTEMTEYLSEKQENEYRIRLLVREKQEYDTQRDKAIAMATKIKSASEMKFLGVQDDVISEMLGLDEEIVKSIIATDTDISTDSTTRPQDAIGGESGISVTT